MPTSKPKPSLNPLLRAPIRSARRAPRAARNHREPIPAWHRPTRLLPYQRLPVVASNVRAPVHDLEPYGKLPHVSLLSFPGAVFVEFLKRLMHNAAQPIFLILDGASYHHGQLVKDYVTRFRGKLRLFFLPPYSPELNPDEQVWNHVKHHGVAKAGLRTGKELRKYVLARLRSLQRLPWTIRMFFLTPAHARHPVCHRVTATYVYLLMIGLIMRAFTVSEVWSDELLSTMINSHIRTGVTHICASPSSVLAKLSQRLYVQMITLINGGFGCIFLIVHPQTGFSRNTQASR